MFAHGFLIGSCGCRASSQGSVDPLGGNEDTPFECKLLAKVSLLGCQCLGILNGCEVIIKQDDAFFFRHGVMVSITRNGFQWQLPLHTDMREPAALRCSRQSVFRWLWIRYGYVPIWGAGAQADFDQPSRSRPWVRGGIRFRAES